jgi:hypothetical protein
MKSPIIDSTPAKVGGRPETVLPKITSDSERLGSGDVAEPKIAALL